LATCEARNAHIGPSRGKRQGHRLTDAPRTSGHQGRFSFQAEIRNGESLPCFRNDYGGHDDTPPTGSAFEVVVTTKSQVLPTSCPAPTCSSIVVSRSSIRP